MHGFLLKYGQKEHLEQLLNGKLYLKCIKFFKENGEDNIGRLDRNENLTAILRYPYFKGELFFNGIKVGIVKDMNVYIPEHDKDFYTHISCFCLTIADIKNWGVHKLADKRMGNFGKDVLLIHNVNEFQKRIQDACANSKNITKLTMDKVAYISKENYHGKVNIFNKFDNFDWQQEYRIAVQNIEECNLEHFYLDIGNIKDIAILSEADKIGYEYVITNKIHGEQTDVLLGTESVQNFINSNTIKQGV